jgi:adenosylhomocysteinase
MDMSFAVQFHSTLYVRENYKTLGRAVHDVSKAIDDVVSKARLEAWGVEIDSLTPEQDVYLNSWELE